MRLLRILSIYFFYFLFASMSRGGHGNDSYLLTNVKSTAGLVPLVCTVRICSKLLSWIPL